MMVLTSNCGFEHFCLALKVSILPPWAKWLDKSLSWGQMFDIQTCPWYNSEHVTGEHVVKNRQRHNSESIYRENWSCTEHMAVWFTFIFTSQSDYYNIIHSNKGVYIVCLKWSPFRLLITLNWNYLVRKDYVDRCINIPNISLACHWALEMNWKSIL